MAGAIQIKHASNLHQMQRMRPRARANMPLRWGPPQPPLRNSPASRGLWAVLKHRSIKPMLLWEALLKLRLLALPATINCGSNRAEALCTFVGRQYDNEPAYTPPVG